jgi:Zn-dependent oligopeptidase
LKKREELEAIPTWIHSGSKKGNQTLIPADQNTMNSILRACDNREVRRQMYEAGNSSPEGNRLALSNLIKSRNDAAEILAFFQLNMSDLSRIYQVLLELEAMSQCVV